MTPACNPRVAFEMEAIGTRETWEEEEEEKQQQQQEQEEGEELRAAKVLVSSS